MFSYDGYLDPTHAWEKDYDVTLSLLKGKLRYNLLWRRHLLPEFGLIGRILPPNPNMVMIL